MRRFNLTFNERQKWTDPNKTRNNPRSCGKTHSFCHLDYQWEDESSKIRALNCPTNPNLPNVTLPKPNEGIITVSYDAITEQNLDDWIAQSMNRNINSMLNPQKKFFIPGPLDQQMRQRYRSKKPVKAGKDDETYFGSTKIKNKAKSYMGTQRKKNVQISELIYDYKRLEPNIEIPGTGIRVRQSKNVVKREIKRRHAILLDKDVHYERLIKQMGKQKQKVNTEQLSKQLKIQSKKQRIYSFNIDSMYRKSSYDDVPNSIIENNVKQQKREELDGFLDANRKFLNRQEELEQRYRVQLNTKAQNTMEQVNRMFQKDAKKDDEFVKSSLNSIKKNLKRMVSINKSVAPTQAKDKKRDAKVMKLLNNMQITSEKIDMNMAKFNVHPNQIFLQHPDGRPQVKWVLKAQQKIKQNQYGLAIDCYKQAIILQPEYFIPIFNIAVLLQKQNMFESAKLWFNLASDFESDSQSVIFGTSVVAIKQLKYQQALSSINELILKLQNLKKKPQLVYYYLRALCEKQLGMLAQSTHDYEIVAKESQPSNYNVLGHFIFSIVFAKSRRISTKFDSLSYLKFRETIFLVLYQNPKKVKQDKDTHDTLAQKLVKFEFFNRFSISLIKKLLKVAKYELRSKGDIIFVNPNQSVLILNGIISMKSHQKNFKRPDTIGVIKQGGVIGTQDVDQVYSRKPNIWYLADSQVELLKVPRKQFNDFWRGQITFEFDFKYNFLKNVTLFKGLPQSTLFKLVQLFELKTFDKNTILYNDCSYRTQLFNKKGHGFGLGKPGKTDLRFLNATKPLQDKKAYKSKGKFRIYKIIKKHLFKFNLMKFSRVKYPGIYVVKDGFMQIENDQGFRINGVIGQRQFFGENLIIDSEGLQKYGRLVVQSEKADVYLLSLDKLVWAFNQQDKQIMLKNTKKRQIIETTRFLSNRFSEWINVKFTLQRN